MLSNGTITVGVDLARGGAITWVSDRADGRNLVNSHDLGRQIQQSYYSGPHPYGAPRPPWTGAGWNPVASGDTFHHAATASVVGIRDGTLHIRSVPYQWALDRVACACVFETWITLHRDRALVRQRLTNRRPDRRQYPAEQQELPAVYGNGILRHLVAYTGERPFEGDAAATIPSTWPARRITASEGWAAMLDARGRGLGVVSPMTRAFDIGFAGPLADGGEHDDQTAYIAPRRVDIIDHDIVYDSRFTLVVGTVDAIRAVALEARADPRPDDRFAGGRAGWTYVNAADRGWRPAGALHVGATAADPQLWGPAVAFRAATVRDLYVAAAFAGGGTGTAQLFWSTAAAPGFSPDRTISVPVAMDGVARVVRFPTAAHPGWTGLITALRLDPPGEAKATATICAIGWRPRPCGASGR